MDEEKIDKILMCQKRTEKLQGGKSDFAYHNTRNSLHNIWTEVYESGDKNPEKIKEIDACLQKLERKAQENEKRKFLNYYSRNSAEADLERIRNRSFN